MFEHYPDLRQYFKGAENFTPDDVQISDRFAKQGQRLLLGTRIIVDTYDDLDTFKAYARETVNRHIKFKMDRNLWLVNFAFFTVMIEHLKEHTTIDVETEKAWLQIGKEFADEAVKHSFDLNLPN
ncbi:unnamed protein product [Gongylonema pulchrum]|uniref:GLOBIN domain-containing protein n=1 Tax=Gongylonema pulchrum TaxID=637853 RepID=A0A183E1W3_9BILA|nr:unnamed protein product [Gongylonema pulchrum]